MSGFNKDWSFKGPNPCTKPKKKYLTKAQKKKRKDAKKKRLKFRAPTDDFYRSREWRKLRYQVLRKYSGRCMCCGRSQKEHKVVIHVDHIKPRSKYPSRALDFTNLQILCEDCNLGKSNIDETDWRPEMDEEEHINAKLDMELLTKLN